MGLSIEEALERDNTLRNLKITTYKAKKGYIFISYKSDNWKKVFTEKVFQLSELGVRVYSDKNFDDKNHSWLEQMDKNIKYSAAVMLFISREYMTSLATLIELLTAIYYDKEIIPVYLEPRNTIISELDNERELEDLEVTATAEEFNTLNTLISKRGQKKFEALVEQISNDLNYYIVGKNLTYMKVYEAFKAILTSGVLQDNAFNKNISSLINTINDAYVIAYGSSSNKADFDPFERPVEEIINSLRNKPVINFNPAEAATTTTPSVAPSPVPAPATPASVPASAVDNTNDDTVNTPVPADKPQAKSGKKQATSTGDITFTLYGKEYTTNQADMMLTFFAQVLVRHQDIISELNSYKGMNFVSETDYSKRENKTDDMLPYFNSCHYFEFPNGDGLCVGTSFSVNDKLKKMALLLSICGEDTSVFHSEQVELPKLKSQAEKGDSSRSGNSSGVNFRVYDESFSLNQTDMLGVICSKLIEKHPDKLAEAADSLLCIDMKDYTGVPKEDKPVYFGSMNQYYLGTTPYCVGGSFGMKDKLKMISKLIAICEEDTNCIEIEGYDIPAPKSSRTSSKKSSFDYFG